MKTVSMALVLLSLAVGRVGAAQLPSAVVTDGLGVNIHFTDGVANAQDLNMIQAAGGKFVRMDCSWAGIETTAGQYNFSAEDSLVNACTARGIRVLYILDYGNNLYGSDPTSAAWQTGFANFAAAAAAHYKGGSSIWEVWNEPDGSTGLNSDANTYMAIAEKTIPAMRAADPNCTIVGPAVSYLGAQSFLTTCFQQGLLNLVDAVSVHGYRDASPGNPESIAATTIGGENYYTVRSLMQTYGGKTLPIVDSEWGWSVGSGGDRPVATAQLQGDYLARSLLVNLSQGIPLSIWYDWMDGSDPTNPEDNFGMVTDTNVAKPAYNEMQLLTKSLRGETFASKLSDGHTSDWLLVFTAPNGQKTLAAWTTGSSRYVGSVTGWGTVDLTLTSTPQYLNPSTIPEPGVLVLLGTGLAGVLAYALRKWK